MLYIGIDLGTSACKLLLTDEMGDIKNIVSRSYPLDFPQPGGANRIPRHGGRRWRRESLRFSADMTARRWQASARAAKCTALSCSTRRIA